MSARSHSVVSHGVDRDWDSAQFRFIFALSFVFYLVAAVGSRLLPANWDSAMGRRSIVVEALGRAGTTAQIAFYG